MSSYLRDDSRRVVIETITNDDNVTFEPFAMNGAIGFRVVEVDTGRVEYLVLVPSGGHQYNEDNGATADTFIYTIAGDDAIALDTDIRENGAAHPADYVSSAIYINHFEKGNHPREEGQD